MSTRTCQTCGEYRVFRTAHVCAPEWKCTEAETRDDHDEYVRVYADTAAEAAKKFALDWWRDDAPAGGDTLDVAVNVDGEPRCFTVTAEWSIDARANERDGWPS